MSLPRKFINNHTGFAVMEALLVILLLAGIVGSGVYVYKHRDDKQPTASTNLSAPLGSTARTDQLNAVDIEQEESIDSEYDAQAQSNVASDTAVMTNVGGASDASDL